MYALLPPPSVYALLVIGIVSVGDERLPQLEAVHIKKTLSERRYLIFENNSH